METATALPINEVIYDPDIQQRANKVDPIHLRRLVDALETGAMFPPIVIDKASRRIVDGIHRYHAVKKYAEEHPEIFNVAVTILCEEKVFADDNEMFKYVLEANSKHGMPWAPIDKQRIALEAERRGISLTQVSELIRTPLAILQKVSATAIIRPGPVGEPPRKEPLKNTLPKAVREAWAGKELNPAQAELNRRMGGMRINYFTDLLILYLEADCWADTPPEGKVRLRELHRLLSEVIQNELVVR
jgi:ParB-like nuclease family protein